MVTFILNDLQDIHVLLQAITESRFILLLSVTAVADSFAD